MGVRHKLTARAVETARHPGRTKHAHRLSDGGGLYLQITAAGTRSWLFRYTLHGKPAWLGLGVFDRTANGLAAARGKAAAQRSILAGGADPLALKATTRHKAKDAAATAGDRTFKAAALGFIKQQAPAWKNAKHAWQVQQTLEAHAFPKIGMLPVTEIGTAEVLGVLTPIWGTIPETAQRLRGRIEAVLDFAKVSGLRSGDNPAAWRGHLARLLPSARKAGGRGHQPALPWAEAAAFVAELQARDGAAARALAFLILTASRTTEVIGARWGEMDLDAGVWTVPAERMKAGREHRVPLSAPALALLRGQLPLSTGPAGAVFQSGHKGRGAAPLSNMAMLALLRRMNAADDAGVVRWRDGRTGAPVTAHGFRSTFRDWVGEATAFPTALAEAALAHANSDRTEAAYARGDLFQKRAALMQAWADYCLPTVALTNINLRPKDLITG